MAVTGFNHYNLRAQRDLLEQLKTFYCDVLGFVPGARPAFRSFGYWLYTGSQDIVHLSEAAPGEFRATHVVTTLDHVAFSCTNSAAMEQTLQQHDIAYQTRFVAQTGIKQLFFHDPAGNGVELNFASEVS